MARHICVTINYSSESRGVISLAPGLSSRFIQPCSYTVHMFLNNTESVCSSNSLYLYLAIATEANISAHPPICLMLTTHG